MKNKKNIQKIGAYFYGAGVAFSTPCVLRGFKNYYRQPNDL